MKKIERTFVMEKETKNTIRFQESTPNENTDDGAELGTVIGPLYIQKEALKYLNFADGDTIKITIENLD
jgi:hypothetical protein